MIMTWLPLPSFTDSIKLLSLPHLAVQRLHVVEIMEYSHAIPEEDSALPAHYRHHELDDDSPIIKMWRGYELQLVEYGLEACEEWASRKGKQDPLYMDLVHHLEWGTTEDASFAKPNWFGDVDFHLGHQAELVRSDIDYNRYFKVDRERELIWPESDRYAT